MTVRRGTRQHSHNRVPTLAEKNARAVNLIAFCTPERFAELTADDVARHSGLPLATAEAMLERARADRKMRA